MNTFLPMRWTSEVVSMELLEFQGDGRDLLFKGSWRCCAKVVLDGAVEIIGVGIGSHVGEKYEVIQRAKKSALTNARKDAFSRLAIVMISMTKVGYYVSPTPLVAQSSELKSP
eukprot:TRINITY_DN2300_c0_g1_i1.p3 TRINITY_DN2300_c0_g1~~TRINITY_DN2300_c0_g1_i1.p3  ORF type:complete len:113 (+),score=13.09 TRINITY_DN2300_c0_g1_i1:563-901(+)